MHVYMTVQPRPQRTLPIRQLALIKEGVKPLQALVGAMTCTLSLKGETYQQRRLAMGHDQPPLLPASSVH